MSIQSAENYIGKGKFYQRFKSASSNLENIRIYHELWLSKKRDFSLLLPSEEN